MGFSHVFTDVLPFKTKIIQDLEPFWGFILAARASICVTEPPGAKTRSFCFILGFRTKKLLGFSAFHRFFGWFTRVKPQSFKFFAKPRFQVLPQPSHGCNCFYRWLGALELLQVDLSLHLPTWTNSSLTAYGFEALPLKFLPLGWYLGHFAGALQGFGYSP